MLGFVDALFVIWLCRITVPSEHEMAPAAMPEIGIDDIANDQTPRAEDRAAGIRGVPGELIAVDEGIHASHRTPRAIQAGEVDFLVVGEGILAHGAPGRRNGAAHRAAIANERVALEQRIALEEDRTARVPGAVIDELVAANHGGAWL